MPIKIVILGGPGDGVVVAQALRDLDRAGKPVVVVGFLNDALPEGTMIDGIPVLGALDSWTALPSDVRFCPALHKVKLMAARAKRILELRIPDERWFSVMHPTAKISDGVRIGCGSFIASYVTVQPGAILGRFISIRAGANVGHDASVGDFAYMGPNSTLSGRARLEDGAHLGPNAAVLDGVKVGRYAVVGLCSAATKNIEEFSVCIGVPARVISTNRAATE